MEEISPKYLDLSTATARAKLSKPTGTTLKRYQRPIGRNKPSQKITNFKASPLTDIVAGANILHERFGNGKIVAVDGTGTSMVATIFFDDGVGEKRIMLKFAKIQVL